MATSGQFSWPSVGISVAAYAQLVMAADSQHSVSFDTAKNRRNAQAFEYGTKEWDEFHTHARNSIESLNNQVKSGGTEDIESASRRRVRGFGAAQIIVTILLTNFNHRKIAAFVSDKIKADAKKQTFGEPRVALVRRRGREWRDPYTGTYPPGVTPPGKATAPPVSDETGGPPLRTQPARPGRQHSPRGQTPSLLDNPTRSEMPSIASTAAKRLEWPVEAHATSA